MGQIKRNNQGAMGVGTLIVFIAMVLVAAVAASVLIDTANKLQQQAQKTGDQSIRETSTSFIVKDVYGKNTGEVSSDTIDELYLKVSLAAGAPAQSFDSTLIELDDGETQYSLEYDSTGTDIGTASGDVYRVEALADYGSSYSTSNPIITQGDTMLIKFNTSQFSTSLTIDPQTEIDIKIIPKHGVATLESFFTPPVYSSKLIHIS
ncbi:MAG: archaellin/type IV pilin N-terminal domain-containing protein [Thermoplasmatota archaeon]